MFTQEELNNIAVLISKAPITGNEAMPVALLLQKISTIMKQPEDKAEMEQPKK